MARGVRGGSANRGARLDNGLLLACLSLAIMALVMPRRFRDGVASALRETVLSPMVALERSASSVRAAIASRDELLMTRGRAATDALNVRAIADENVTMRRLMGLSARLADGFVVADVLPRRGVNDDFTLTLSVGSAAGVQPFAPVVTADGLVGMVERVDEHTAFAITWADPSFRVSAMSVDNRAFGIVQPHLGTGAERLMLELKGVPFRDKLDSGAVIVSSGLGPTYPRGIPVGIVIGEVSTPEKWARTYLLMPVVLPAAIGPVLVLRAERGARGVNQIWTNVASAD
ncbi:MAG: rod shape-determining protein MreC, partial [Gemmatimonas sp.]